MFDSFMPIHTGAETDLRFVYCAGKEIEMVGMFYLAVPNQYAFDEISKLTNCCISCHLFYVGGLERLG